MIHPLRHRLVRDAQDLTQVQRLRYDVFVAEMGARGALVDHARGLERDRFDAHSDHLMLFDGDDRLIGTSRIMDTRQAAQAGGFSSASEFDLDPLIRSGLPLLELGRVCLHRDWRGGTALHRLWDGVAEIVRARGTRLLFGAASGPGIDPRRWQEPLTLLQERYPAPALLRPRAIGAGWWMPDQSPADPKAALREVPALIKAYLRLGGGVGLGACPDPAFGTTDVCMVLDVARIPTDRATLFTRAE